MRQHGSPDVSRVSMIDGDMSLQVVDRIAVLLALQHPIFVEMHKVLECRGFGGLLDAKRRLLRGGHLMGWVRGCVGVLGTSRSRPSTLPYPLSHSDIPARLTPAFAIVEMKIWRWRPWRNGRARASGWHLEEGAIPIGGDGDQMPFPKSTYYSKQNGALYRALLGSRQDRFAAL